MNIVFSCDNNFIKPLSVTVSSILSNSNKDDEFDFFILDGDITSENKQKIEQLKLIKNFNLTYLKINPSDFSDCPLSCHFKIPTYYRIKLPSLLNTNKVLYMDCDIIVRTSLKEFYNIDFADKYAVVVKDSLSSFLPLSEHMKKIWA